MYYSTEYNSIIGKLLLVCDDENLVGLWMMGQKYFCPLKEHPVKNSKPPFLYNTERGFLSCYFSASAQIPFSI